MAQTPQAVDLIANILCVPGVAEFDIESPAGRACAPQLASRDPACSNSLLKCEFPPTVFPERNADISLTLPQSAKPEALILAHKIWTRVTSIVPETALGDHTEGHHKPWHSFQTL